MRPRQRISWLACAVVATGLTTLGAQSPARDCEPRAGEYAECRFDAEERFARTHDAARLTADLGRCAAQPRDLWSEAEATATRQGRACPGAGAGGTVVAASLSGPPVGGFLGIVTPVFVAGIVPSP